MSGRAAAGDGLGADAARLPPLPVARWDDSVLQALETGRSALLSDDLQAALDSRDPGRLAAVLPNAITSLLYNPRLAGAWLDFNGALLRDLSLPARLRELMVLRVAWRTRSRYEWLQHVRMAPRFGITESEVASIAGDAGGTSWEALEADLITATDQLLDHHTVERSTWDRLAAHLDEGQLVEVPFIVGAYTTLAMAFNAFGVQPDPQYRSVAAPALPATEV